MPKKENDEDPVCVPLQHSPVEGIAAYSSSCDTSQEDSGIQDGEKSTESTEAADATITLDATGEPELTDEGNESLAEASMPEGVKLDTEGEEIIVEEEKSEGPLTALDAVPSYDSDFKGILTDVEYSMITGKKINEARPKQCCFNCLGDHTMNDCPQPPDYSRIAVNRKKLMSNRVSNVRYHEDCENKFGQFQPGKISENLRHALGLRPNQLPLYIYRMRVLGYPPGWMREAEVHQTDVKMYDAVGKRVSHPGEEDGEAEPSTVKYRPEKLVSFPGFNDSMPRGVLDECQWYDFPPMQPYHQKSEFLHFMNQSKAGAYKKKKLKDTELRSRTPPATEEMDVDDSDKSKPVDIVFNPPLPNEPPPLPPLPQEPPPSTPPTKRSKELEDGEISEDSQDSVGGLLIKKQKILQELEGEKMQNNNKEGESSQNENKPNAKNSSGNREGEMQNNNKEGESSQNENKPNAKNSSGNREGKMQNNNKEGESSQNENKPNAKNSSGNREGQEDSEDSQLSLMSSADPAQSENSCSGDGTSDEVPKTKRHHRSHSKGFKLGTMIPASCTPYNCLPSPEKWTVDVSDHIMFDNLPDALGTWDKMKGIMGKVKTKMSILHADEGD